jgi:ABC-type amino acid transport system permease subunit
VRADARLAVVYLRRHRHRDDREELSQVNKETKRVVFNLIAFIVIVFIWVWVSANCATTLHFLGCGPGG